MRQVRLLIIVSVTFILISVTACDPFEWQYEEVSRFTSPDGAVDAIWTRGSGGATTGIVYSLYLAPKGLKFDQNASSFKHATFSGDHLEDLQVVWRTPKLLEIHFKHARIFAFSNYWRYWNPASPDADRPYVVESRLMPQAEDSTLLEEDR